MAFWLFKQEPGCYSYSDLERDGLTNWDGVSNALALKHLRTCQEGDRVFYYHTGEEKAIVGVMEIVGAPFPDPNLNDEKLVVVPVRPLHRLKRNVTLAELKQLPEFADWELIRISRLSVMPCSAARWKRIEQIARSAEESDSQVVIDPEQTASKANMAARTPGRRPGEQRFKK